MSENFPKNRFSKTIFWVTLAHIVVLFVIGFWPTRKVKLPPDVTMIEMIDTVGPIPSSKGPQPEPKVSTGPVLGKPDEPAASAQTKTTPAPAPKAAPAPPPTPTPPPKTPEPVTPTPEETPPTPPSKPTPEVNDFAPQDSKKETKKEPKTPTKSTPKKTESKRKPVKVNLKEVARKNTDSDDDDSDSEETNPSPHKPSKNNHSTSHSTQDSDGDSSPDAIAARLGSAVGKAGHGGAVQIGPLSIPGGGTGNFGSYFSLIRKQMYDAWNRPVQLSQKDLSALLKITIENDGRISNVTLVTGSGIRDFDESIVAAAKRVGRIREPLPEGLDHEITIRFKLDD
ncbi:MAG: energy transducer TonB [Verrucomicrobiota bacterium]